MEFFRSYFSTFDFEKIDVDVQLLDGDLSECWEIYLRILLANIEVAIEALSSIEKNISFAYEEEKIKVAGGIKGRLLINEYTQNKSILRIPREYPCSVKRKSYGTPENFYLAHIVIRLISILDYIIKRLNNEYQSRLLSEYQRLNAVKNYMSSLLRKQPISYIIKNYGIKAVMDQLQNDKLLLIENRLSKGKIRNAQAYRRLFSWYEKYKHFGISWVDTDNIGILIYDDSFRNKLFEIWNLYMIMNCLRTKHDFAVKQFALVPQMKTPVFILSNPVLVCQIEIYYQKGAGIYWDDTHPQFWSYEKDGDLTGLNGIPDITLMINKNGTEKIVIIDLKNRMREIGKNSEEIYKMIGYYSNFDNLLSSKYPSASNRMGVLIFRHSEVSFTEHIVSHSGDNVYLYSTNPVDDDTLNLSQFEDLCDKIASL